MTGKDREGEKRTEWSSKEERKQNWWRLIKCRRDDGTEEKRETKERKREGKRCERKREKERKRHVG